MIYVYIVILWLACISPVMVLMWNDKRKEAKALHNRCDVLKEIIKVKEEHIKLSNEVIAQQRAELEKLTFVPYEVESIDIKGNIEEANEIIAKLNNGEEIPFAEPIKICPQCGADMTRHTSKTWFCDNMECNRKQWHISKLEGSK